VTDITIPLVGPSNLGAHVKADSQRTINLYPVKVEREGEKARWHLVGSPGLSLFATLDDSPIRGRYVFRGRAFFVAGAWLYEVYDTGSYRKWGTIGSVRGRVSMAELLDDLVIGDGSGFYAFNLTTGLVSAIPDAPIGRWCIAFDQRMLYLEKDSGRVYYSALNDATDVGDFFTAENKPDDALALMATEDQIWIPGEDGGEVWYDAGDADNPFQRIPGGVYASGLLSEDTLQYIDNSIWWVEKSKEGSGIVRRSQGFTPVRVSTAAVERFTSSASNLSAYSYQERDGKTFYVLNADEGTWAYDLKDQEWHERAFLNQATGTLERARAELHAFAYGKHLVSDYETAKIYEQSLDYYDDDGVPLVARRYTAHTDADGRAVTIDELYLDCATGVGTVTGQGANPVAMLRYSTDGGQNYSNELSRDMGAIGETRSRVRWHSLGMGRDWVFEITITDPVQRVLLGAKARVRVGRR